MDKTAKYPGFGLAVNAMPQVAMRGDRTTRDRFPAAVLDWEPVPVTKRERTMLAFMDAITDKPEWRRKVFDDSILQIWKDEASAMEDFSDAMFDYVRSATALRVFQLTT